MINTLYNALLEWHRNAVDRVKLQHTYLAITIISLVVAGLASLMNEVVGKRMLIITAVALGVYLVNAIIWALLNSLVLDGLSGRHKKR